jgi:hypothetical protein
VTTRRHDTLRRLRNTVLHLGKARRLPAFDTERTADICEDLVAG